MRLTKRELYLVATVLHKVVGNLYQDENEGGDFREDSGSWMLSMSREDYKSFVSGTNKMIEKFNLRYHQA